MNKICKIIQKIFFPKKEVQEEKSETPQKRLFWGVDLDEWQFLGTGRATWTSQGKDVDFLDVAFFIKEEGEFQTRKYVPMGDAHEIRNFRSHPFLLYKCPLWEHGEKNLYSVIQQPSEWLIKQVKDQYGYTFQDNKDGGKWVKDEEVK